MNGDAMQCYATQWCRITCHWTELSLKPLQSESEDFSDAAALHRANLISNSYTCDLLPRRLLLFRSQRIPQFLLLRAFSATWKTPIGLPRQGPSGEALIGAQQEISENSGFGVSAASSGKHGNTSATSDTDILKVWHVYKTKKGGKKTDLSNAVHRRAQYHLVCHGPEAACRLPLVPTILIQNGCHGGQVYHQHLCNNYLSLHAKFWLIFPCQLMLSKLILLFNLFPTKRE